MAELIACPLLSQGIASGPLFLHTAEGSLDSSLFWFQLVARNLLVGDGLHIRVVLIAQRFPDNALSEINLVSLRSFSKRSKACSPT